MNAKLYFMTHKSTIMCCQIKWVQNDKGGWAKQGHIPTSISQTRNGCHNNTLLIHVRNNEILHEIKKFLNHKNWLISKYAVNEGLGFPKQTVDNNPTGTRQFYWPLKTMRCGLRNSNTTFIMAYRTTLTHKTSLIPYTRTTSSAYYGSLPSYWGGDSRGHSLTGTTLSHTYARPPKTPNSFSLSPFTPTTICQPHSNISYPHGYNMCPTLQNRVLETLTVARFIKWFPAICGTRSSLSSSHCAPYSEPAKFSQHPYNPGGKKNYGASTPR
jgi:hypothetical protein